MGTVVLTYTATGSVAGNTVVASGLLPAFSGDFTVSGSRTGDTTNGVSTFWQFVRGSDASVCWSTEYSFGAGEASWGPLSGTVNLPSSSWPCLNWTLQAQKTPIFSQPFVAGAVYTWTISGTNVPNPLPCAYGTQPAPTAAAMTLITDALVDTVCTALDVPWLAILFDPIIGLFFDTGILCGTGPPTTAAISVQTILDTISDKLAIFQSLAWYALCQCTPAPTGSPPPTAPTPPIIELPTGFPARPTYTCSDTDVCTTLELILKRLDELSRSQQVYVTSTNTTITQPTLKYAAGTVHASLSGSGSLSIAGLVGIRMQLVSPPPGLQLPGVPPYLWDVGWMSMSDGGAMLQELRFTRSEVEWFPRESPLATTFGYYLNPGVTATMTELVPA